jgi:hypothetical protein
MRPLHLLSLHFLRELLKVLHTLGVIFVARIMCFAQDEHDQLVAVNLRTNANIS